MMEKVESPISIKSFYVRRRRRSRGHATSLHLGLSRQMIGSFESDASGLSHKKKFRVNIYLFHLFPSRLDESYSILSNGNLV